MKKICWYNLNNLSAGQPWESPGRKVKNAQGI